MLQTGIFTSPSEIYVKVLKAFGGKFLPFLKMHYFGTLNANGSIQGGYHAYKKAVIISLFNRIQLFDKDIFENFSRHFGLILNQAS